MFKSFRIGSKVEDPVAVTPGSTTSVPPADRDRDQAREENPRVRVSMLSELNLWEIDYVVRTAFHEAWGTAHSDPHYDKESWMYIQQYVDPAYRHSKKGPRTLGSAKSTLVQLGEVVKIDLQVNEVEQRVQQILEGPVTPGAIREALVSMMNVTVDTTVHRTIRHYAPPGSEG